MIYIYTNLWRLVYYMAVFKTRCFHFCPQNSPFLVVVWEFLNLKKTSTGNSWAQIIVLEHNEEFCYVLCIMTFIQKLYYFLIGTMFPHMSAERNSCCFHTHVLWEAVCSNNEKLLAGLNLRTPSRKTLLIVAYLFGIDLHVFSIEFLASSKLHSLSQ